MVGTIMVVIVSAAAYAAGVPLIPLLLFVIAGTYIEYRWIHKNRDS
jgi:tryptophan-rich sensory protein